MARRSESAEKISRRAVNDFDVRAGLTLKLCADFIYDRVQVGGCGDVSS
jgi:hypothetical protein